MAAGRAAADGDEVGVAPVLRDVLLDPGQGPLAVDDVVGPDRLGAQPVVDRDAHPAPGHQLEHHRLALLALVADDPGPAVDVHHDRRLGGWGQAGPVDVETMALAAVAPVVDVAVVLDGARPERDAPGHPPPLAPGRGGGAVGHRKGRAAHLVQRGGDHLGRPLAGEAEPDQADPLGDGQGQTEPAGPAVQGPGPDEQGGGEHLPHDGLEGQLVGDPGQGEADDGKRFPADGVVGQQHGGTPHQGDDQEGVWHHSIIARSRPVAQIRVWLLDAARKRPGNSARQAFVRGYRGKPFWLLS